MLFETKVDQDANTMLMIKNLVQDQLDFNLNKREDFANWRDSYTYLLEEVQESEEALFEVKKELEIIWEAIRSDAPGEELRNRTNLLLYKAYHHIQEGVHIAAVARKILEQIEKAPTVAATTEEAHSK